jgi:hypothetical protein
VVVVVGDVLQVGDAGGQLGADDVKQAHGESFSLESTTLGIELMALV